MEGIPKIPMIAPDMKVPDEPMPADWVPKLREYIFTHYNDDPSKFNEAFKELQSMRYHACRYGADVESICIMKRYFAQLQMIKSRFPMEPNEPVSISFAWSDRSCEIGAAYDDINFEMCCIMYNIGAAHATIGANENRSDSDSRKNAFTHFQNAAWPFEYLRDSLGASKFTASNFEPELLTFFSQILLAQAHECLTEKAIHDQRANNLIAKLARYASETYFELKLRLEQESLFDCILSGKLKFWKKLCESKAHFYEAVKRYYIGLQCCEEEKHGESVAHLTASLERIKEAQKIVQKDKKESESMKPAIEFALEIISQKEAKVRKENNFVYHDRVPKAEDCSQVEAVTRASAISFDPCKRDIAGDDLFAALLPANCLKNVSLYSEEKAKLKRQIIQKIEKKDSELEQYLLSLQLNQINLDQNVDEMRLPEELLQASAAFTAQPDAFYDLLDRLNGVAEKSSEAEIKLTELRHRLLNVKCPQLEEDQGFMVISSKVDELMDHHIQARANNTELQKALASQSEQLKLLALPLTELANNICDKVVSVPESAEGTKLREMVDKVEEMKRGRIKLFENFSNDLENDDITAKVLADKEFSVDTLFEKELKKHDKCIKIIEMNLDAQERILNALTEANANFAECRRDIVENNEKRRSQSVALVTAYQIFAGVKEKTEVASTFYNQLFALIGALDKSIAGMEDAYNGERERHEEQKRILAEKTKLYRERTAMESNNPQLSSTSNDRRRPKLGDYMAFYRNKMVNSSNSDQIGALSQNISSSPYATMHQHPDGMIQNPSQYSAQNIFATMPQNPDGMVQNPTQHSQNVSPSPYATMPQNLDGMVQNPGKHSSQNISPSPHANMYQIRNEMVQNPPQQASQNIFATMSQNPDGMIQKPAQHSSQNISPSPHATVYQNRNGMAQNPAQHSSQNIFTNMHQNPDEIIQNPTQYSHIPSSYATMPQNPNGMVQNPAQNSSQTISPSPYANMYQNRNVMVQNPQQQASQGILPTSCGEIFYRNSNGMVQNPPQQASQNISPSPYATMHQNPDGKVQNPPERASQGISPAPHATVYQNRNGIAQNPTQQAFQGISPSPYATLPQNPNGMVQNLSQQASQNVSPSPYATMLQNRNGIAQNPPEQASQNISPATHATVYQNPNGMVQNPQQQASQGISPSPYANMYQNRNGMAQNPAQNSSQNISPSPYANMYQNPSVAPTNSPWHRIL